LNQIAVTLDIVIPQVIQQPPPLPDEHEETPARVVVLFVHLEVFREVVDPPGEYRHLDIRRAGIGLMSPELRDDFRLLLYI